MTDNEQAICFGVWFEPNHALENHNQHNFEFTTSGSSWAEISCDATSCVNARSFTEDTVRWWFKFVVAPSYSCFNIDSLTSDEVVREPKSRFLIHVEKDCTNYAVAKTPFTSLPATVPKEFNPTYEGVIIDPIDEDSWVVPYKFYSLS